MKMRSYSVLENIIHKGDIGAECFFVVSGAVQICATDAETKNVTVYAETGPGTFFGEVSLFYDVPRTAEVRAGPNGSVLYVLSKKDIQHVLREYPDIQERMTKEAAANLEKATKRREAIQDIQKKVQEDAAASPGQGAAPGLAAPPAEAFDINRFDIDATIAYLKKVKIARTVQADICRSLFSKS